MKTIHNKPQEQLKLISNSTFSAAMQEADGYNKWVLDYHRSYLADPLLEIGLGHGTFYGMFCKQISTYVGLDIDQTLVEHAQENYPNNQYVCADLASNTFSKRFTKQQFNSILCLNVLEHIEDHEKALKNMLDVLTPSGHILLFVPAFQSLYTDLDRLAGHYRRYRISDIRLLASKTGGSIVEWSYFNFLGGIGWWVNRLMSHKSLNDPSVNHQVRIFNKIILPFSKLIQPLTKKFFGQSLYVVLKKDVK